VLFPYRSIVAAYFFFVMSEERKMARRQCREYDTANMNEALVETQKAVECGKMPFGAVLANSDGIIVCRAHNQCEAAARRGGGGVGDVTRHAEMELIRRFTTFLPESERRECTLYTSTEPCVMCAGAIYWSGVRRIVYGCSAAQLEEQVSGPGGFDIPIETLYGLSDATRDKMSVVGPILVDESLELHRNSGVWNKEKATSMPLQKAAEQDIAVEASLLTSGLGSAAVADDGVVPIIDLSIGTPAEVAQKLWEAATQVGFFTIVGHGIDSSITDAAFAASETFFAQSVDDKKQQSPLDMSINCGYEYFNQIRPSTGVADQKESIQITARAGCMEGRWPPNQEFRHATETLLNAAHKLAGRLLDLLEPMATPHVPPGTLSKSHTLWQEDGQCTLRLLHYPSLEAEETEKLLTQGYWRAGPHTGKSR